MNESNHRLKENILLYLINWIKNINNNINNESILLIDTSIKDCIIKLIEKDKLKEVEIFDLSCSELEYNQFLKSSKQKIVIYNPLYESLKDFEMVKYEKKYLFIHNVKEDEISSYYNYYSKIDIEIDENIKDYIFIKKIDICKLISSKIEKEPIILEEILKNYILFFSIFYSSNSSIFKDIKYLLFIDLYPSELKLLINNKILTSRFGIFLYRLTNFKFTENKTRIGRYYAKSFESKSKVFVCLNNERFNGYFNIFSGKKSIRGYDLLKNENEEKIREEIAKNLLSLNLDERLTINTISNVTKISIKTIEKLQREILINKIC
jgi:hypothetical protein